MADKKISALTAASTPLGGTEVVPLVQSSTTKNVSIANLTAGRAVSAASLSTTGNIVSNTLLRVTNAGQIEQNGGNGGLYFLNTAVGAAATNQRFLTTNALGVAQLQLQLAGGTNQINSLYGDTRLETGNLVIGTSGKGIDFSATGQATGMTSELFSDYEEGTWSPGLSSAGGAFTSVTFDSSTGKYTKIGRTVYVSGSFFTSGAITVGSASGQVYITGLPFTVGEAGVGNVWFNPDSANYNQPTALATGCVANSTQLQLFKNGTVNNPAFVVSELYTGGGPGNNYLFEATYQV